MYKLEQIAEQIRRDFEEQNTARDRALAQARSLTRECALAIRAVHRREFEAMQAHLDMAHQLATELRAGLEPYPDLYHSGYTQDALKEYAEANITCALIRHEPLPTPQELGLLPATYLNGLAESIGELRRRILDILRHGYSEEVEVLLNHMDDIYAILVTMDYPDAITAGLRRQTDIARSLIERTRGEVTFSLRSQHLERSLAKLLNALPNGSALDLSPSTLSLPEED
ncbi:MAG: haloacid dehalogenase [Anaerolineales bacterium]|nr:haloacid dehalogenase [Anaerolineales bacterium]MCX7609621.1 haloacid dehalogenase [Anaerolineales bacterium]MDW8226436.1 haloacid dehalogenase [Anaerolineales bacterium]